MKTKKDVDGKVSKVWIVCPVCENHYPSFGNAPLCDVCGYDDFAGFRPEVFKMGRIVKGLRWPN